MYQSEIPQFQIVKGTFTWQEAKADAEARGGRLAVLNSQDKIDIANKLLEYQSIWSYLWIGAEKAAGSSSWNWINGSEILTNNWGVGEPNGPTGMTLHPMIWSYADAQPIKWSDENGSLEISYLLENFFTLSTSVFSNGIITGAGEYLPRTNATITATAQSGYIFSSWTGDVSGADNPLTVLINSDKTVGATFVEDTRDPDNDGLTNYQELVVYGSNPDVADTDGDSINDGAEVQEGRNPNVAEAVVLNLVAKQRTGTKFFDITYDLASTTSTVRTSLEISSDGGATYAVPVTSITGAIGDGITVGTGKLITWNAGVDWDGGFKRLAQSEVVGRRFHLESDSRDIF